MLLKALALWIKGSRVQTLVSPLWFQRLGIFCFQVAIWLKYCLSDVKSSMQPNSTYIKQQDMWQKAKQPTYVHDQTFETTLSQNDQGGKFDKCGDIWILSSIDYQVINDWNIQSWEEWQFGTGRLILNSWILVLEAHQNTFYSILEKRQNFGFKITRDTAHHSAKPLWKSIAYTYKLAVAKGGGCDKRKIYFYLACEMTYWNL